MLALRRTINGRYKCPLFTFSRFATLSLPRRLVDQNAKTPMEAPAGYLHGFGEEGPRPCWLRPGQRLLPPPVPLCSATLGRWERTSKKLEVNAAAKQAFGRLLPFLRAEVEAVGDADMQQEVDVLARLAAA